MGRELSIYGGVETQPKIGEDSCQNSESELVMAAFSLTQVMACFLACSASVGCGSVEETELESVKRRGLTRRCIDGEHRLEVGDGTEAGADPSCNHWCC